MNASQTERWVDFFYNHADERIRDKFLMGSPYKIVLIYLCYIAFVTKILPKFMKNQEPIDYNKYSFYHNLIIYARSCYFVSKMSYLWFYQYSWTCQTCDRSNSWLSDFEMQLAHEFVISKFIYTFQSVVIEMSKKSDEYTTYVWIHHSHLPVMMWVSANYYPGGHSLFIYYVNVLEHFVQLSIQMMYVIFKLKFLRPYLKRTYIFLTVSCDDFYYNYILNDIF